MHASLPEGDRWSDATSLHDGPRGVVARIRDPASAQPLIVKRIPAPADQRASLVLGLMGVSMVDHPGVGAIRGVRPVQGAVELVRDDLPESWQQYAESPPEWTELRERTLELLEALAAIHGDGCVHGAVRPTNVRWADKGLVVLVDGGWREGDRAMTPADDLYDVGSLLWLACVGQAPDPDPEDRAFVPRRAVPQALGLLLANLLHPDPLWRYDLAADVATELRAVGEPVAPDHHEAHLRPGPVAPGVAMTGPVPWRRPHPEPMPPTRPDRPDLGWRLHQPPLVGRDDLLDALWASARSAESGPVVVLLVGARGMGRTRVARRFVREISEGGWADPVWVSHDGDPAHDGVFGAMSRAFAPRHPEPERADEQLARRLARARGVILEDVADDAAALRRALGPTRDGQTGRMDPVQWEFSRRLAEHAWRGRSVLVIDDAHRAEGPGEGLELATSLLDTEVPLLVVATIDLDALDDEGVARRVARLEQAGARKVLLRPVTSDHLHSLSEGAPEPIAPAAKESLVRTAEGCPEVARQQLLALMEVGVRDDEGRMAWPGGASDFDWLSARISRIAERSGHARRVIDALHLACLAGSGMPSDLMHAFLGPAVVDAANSGLWSRHQVEPATQEGSWVLSGLVHEALVSKVQARADRPFLHRRLAEAFGRQAGSWRAIRSVRHGAEAGDLGRAWPRLLGALPSCWAFGRRGALGLAASLAGTEGAPEELWLWSVRERPFDDARLTAATEALEQTERKDLLAEVVVAMGRRALAVGRTEDAERAFKRAKGLAPDKAAQATAIAGLGAVAHRTRNFSGAEVHFTRALHRMVAADAPRSMAQVMLEQGFLARRMGRFREAAELCDEAADAYREADDLRGVARARLALARVRRQQLQLDAARSWVEVARTTSRRLLDPDLSREVSLVEGDVARQAGDAEGADAAYRRYLSGAGHEPVGTVVAELGLAQLALTHGDAHEAYERANAAAAALESLPEHWLWAPYRLVVSALLADRGDHMQTWQWLWSASELGLGDTVDRDTAALLTRVGNVGKLAGWGNVIRVAAGLAVEQLERLGERDAAKRVQQDVTGLIRK